MAARRLEVRGGSGAQGFMSNSRGPTRDGPTLRMLEAVLLAGMHEQGQLSSDGGYYSCSVAPSAADARLSMVIYDITCSAKLLVRHVKLSCASFRLS
jgi:hypothetical protein